VDIHAKLDYIIQLLEKRKYNQAAPDELDGPLIKRAKTLQPGKYTVPEFCRIIGLDYTKESTYRAARVALAAGMKRSRTKAARFYVMPPKG
jgi:hypothetical protein